MTRIAVIEDDLPTSNQLAGWIRSARSGIVIDWRRHARTGVPVTLLTLGIAAAWLAWRAGH